MLDDRVQYALDNFIEEGYFESMQSSYLLEEYAKDGRSKLNVHISGDNLCLRDFDSKRRCAFVNTDKEYGFGRSSDHVIFQNSREGWVMHLIEMKTSVGNGTWQDIKLKTRSSYLHCMALAEFLGIKFVDIKVYTTYEYLKFGDIKNTKNIAIHKPLIGLRLPNYKKEEWDSKRIMIRLGNNDENIKIFAHEGIEMKRNNNNFLEGDLEIF